MMNNKFELGPVQKRWIKSLREHPERQMSGRLGMGTIHDYKACCLGELGIISDTCEFIAGVLREESGSVDLLRESYHKIGLHASDGAILDGRIIDKTGSRFYSLSAANDSGMTWPEIADYVELNPEKIFFRSV